MKQILSVGFKTPTPIQEHCIPPILEGVKVYLTPLAARVKF